jgi:hypothetical protein
MRFSCDGFGGQVGGRHPPATTRGFLVIIPILETTLVEFQREKPCEFPMQSPESETHRDLCAFRRSRAHGYSRMYRDDLAQLEAVIPLYDAFYRWCRDAVNETHA